MGQFRDSCRNTQGSNGARETRHEERVLERIRVASHAMAVVLPAAGSAGWASEMSSWMAPTVPKVAPTMEKIRMRQFHAISSGLM